MQQQQLNEKETLSLSAQNNLQAKQAVTIIINSNQQTALESSKINSVHLALLLFVYSTICNESLKIQDPSKQEKLQYLQSVSKFSVFSSFVWLVSEASRLLNSQTKAGNSYKFQSLSILFFGLSTALLGFSAQLRIIIAEKTLPYCAGNIVCSLILCIFNLQALEHVLRKSSPLTITTEPQKNLAINQSSLYACAKLWSYFKDVSIEIYYQLARRSCAFHAIVFVSATIFMMTDSILYYFNLIFDSDNSTIPYQYLVMWAISGANILFRSEKSGTFATVSCLWCIYITLFYFGKCVFFNMFNYDINLSCWPQQLIYSTIFIVKVAVTKILIKHSRCG